MQLYSGFIQRKDIQEATGLKGKELTEFIRGEINRGALRSVMRYLEPHISSRRKRFFVKVAQQQDMFA